MFGLSGSSAPAHIFQRDPEGLPAGLVKQGGGTRRGAADARLAVLHAGRPGGPVWSVRFTVAMHWQ